MAKPTTQRRLVPDPEVCRRYSIHTSTLYNWDHDPELNFPQAGSNQSARSLRRRTRSLQFSSEPRSGNLLLLKRKGRTRTRGAALSIPRPTSAAKRKLDLRCFKCCKPHIAKLPSGLQVEPAGRARAGRNSPRSLMALGAEAPASFIQTGQYLIEAKEELDRDEFEALVRLRLDFDASVARKLMRVAGDRTLCAHVHKLPPCWSSLYELSKLEDDALEAAIADGGSIQKSSARTRSHYANRRNRKKNPKRSPRPHRRRRPNQTSPLFGKQPPKSRSGISSTPSASRNSAQSCPLN